MAQKADVYLLLLQFYVATDLGSKAIWPLACNFCRLISIEPPAEFPTDEDVTAAQRNTAALLENRSIESIEFGRVADAEYAQRGFALLALLVRVPNARLIIAYKALSLVLTDGINQHSPACMLYGVFWMCLATEISPPRAAELSELALRLLDRWPHSPSRGFAYQIYGNYTHLLTNHPRECIPFLVDATKMDLENFEFFTAAASCSYRPNMMFFAAENLDDVLLEADECMKLLQGTLHLPIMVQTIQLNVEYLRELQVGAAVIAGTRPFPSPRSIALGTAVRVAG